MPKMIYDDYGHLVEVPTMKDKVLDFVDGVKNIPNKIKLKKETSRANRKNTIKACETAIALLAENPNNPKSSEAIQMVRDSIHRLELTYDVYGPVISAESMETFISTLESIGTEESKKIAEEMKRQMSCHPDRQSVPGSED